MSPVVGCGDEALGAASEIRVITAARCRTLPYVESNLCSFRIECTTRFLPPGATAIVDGHAVTGPMILDGPLRIIPAP